MTPQVVCMDPVRALEWRLTACHVHRPGKSPPALASWPTGPPSWPEVRQRQAAASRKTVVPARLSFSVLPRSSPAKYGPTTQGGDHDANIAALFGGPYVCDGRRPGVRAIPV